MEIIELGTQVVSRPVVATVGFFDGVHAGHRFLIEQVKNYARQKGWLSAVVTFKTHPRKSLHKDYVPELLTTYEEKLTQLASTGIDLCLSMEFSTAVSQLSARQFIHEILKEKLNVSTLFVGYDHRFGHNRNESYPHYKHYAAEVGMDVVQAKEFNPAQHVSSSHIRKLLECGEVQSAAKLLTYTYSLQGTVVAGFQIGRTIGYPTANIQPSDAEKIIPSNGIYAVRIHLGDDPKAFSGMLYIGNRPTLNDDAGRSIEVNIFDLNADLYSRNIRLDFISFVRGDQQFASLDELKEQIGRDKEAVLEIMGAGES